jgi:hypothetical protein
MAKSGKKLVKNVTEQSYALPDGTYLPAGETTVVDGAAWEAAQENDTVAEWVDEGYFEVTDAPKEPEEEKKPATTQAPANKKPAPER